jgi:hypothetical protein
MVTGFLCYIGNLGPVGFLFQVIVSASMFGERAKHGRWVPVGLVSVGRSEVRPVGGFGCSLVSSELVERQLEAAGAGSSSTNIKRAVLESSILYSTEAERSLSTISSGWRESTITADVAQTCALVVSLPSLPAAPTPSPYPSMPFSTSHAPAPAPPPPSIPLSTSPLLAAPPSSSLPPP